MCRVRPPPPVRLLETKKVPFLATGSHMKMLFLTVSFSLSVASSGNLAHW